MKPAKMKLIFLAAFIVVSGAAKLDKTYLPPLSAQSAGGNPSDLQTPLSSTEKNTPRGFSKYTERNDENLPPHRYPTAQSQFTNQKQNNNLKETQYFNYNNGADTPVLTEDKQNLFVPNQRFEPLSHRISTNNKELQNARKHQNYRTDSYYQTENPINYPPEEYQKFSKPNQYQQDKYFSNGQGYNVQSHYQKNRNYDSDSPEENGNYPKKGFTDRKIDEISSNRKTPIPPLGTHKQFNYRKIGSQENSRPDSNQGSDSLRSHISPAQLHNQLPVVPLTKTNNYFERPQAAQERSAEVLQFENDITGDDFHYKFETDNGITAENYGHASNGVQAQGGFSYIGDDGEIYTIAYTADEDGYRPVGSHIPTPPPIPEAILRSLEQNARDEAAGIIDDGMYDPQKYGPDKSSGNDFSQFPQPNYNQFYSGREKNNRSQFQTLAQKNIKSSDFTDNENYKKQEEVGFYSDSIVANKNINSQNGLSGQNNLLGRTKLQPSISEQRKTTFQQPKFDASSQLQETPKNTFLLGNNNQNQNVNTNYQKYNNLNVDLTNPVQQNSYGKNNQARNQHQRFEIRGPPYLPPENSFNEPMTSLSSQLKFQKDLSNQNPFQFTENKFVNPSEDPKPRKIDKESNLENQKTFQNLDQTEPKPLNQQEQNRKYPFGTEQKYTQKLKIPSQKPQQNSPTNVVQNDLKKDLPSFLSVTEHPSQQTTGVEDESDECRTIQCLRTFQKNNNFDYGDTSELDKEQQKEYDENFDINQFESQQQNGFGEQSLSDINQSISNFGQDQSSNSRSSFEPLQQSNARFQHRKNEIYNYPRPTQQYNDQQQNENDNSNQYEGTTENDNNSQLGIEGNQKEDTRSEQNNVNTNGIVRPHQKQFLDGSNNLGLDETNQNIPKQGKVFSPGQAVQMNPQQYKNIKVNSNTQPKNYNKQPSSYTPDKDFSRAHDSTSQGQFPHDVPLIQTYDEPSNKFLKKNNAKAQQNYQDEYSTENQETEPYNQHIENQANSNNIKKESNILNQQVIANNLRPQQYQNNFKQFHKFNDAQKEYYPQPQSEHQQLGQSSLSQQSDVYPGTDKNSLITTELPSERNDGEVYQYNKPEPVPADSDSTTETGLENSDTSSTTTNQDYFTDSVHSNNNRYSTLASNRQEEFPRFRKPPSYDDESGYQY